jgi:hypothetical protein
MVGALNQHSSITDADNRFLRALVFAKPLNIAKECVYVWDILRKKNPNMKTYYGRSNMFRDVPTTFAKL